MDSYKTTLEAIPPDVSLGCSTIHVYRSLELSSSQVGYSIKQTGESLVGEKDGAWRGTWLVIGYDETSGDPIFIDTAEGGYPVYTAIAGRGRWDPLPIAVSLASFGLALSAIAVVARGREHPVALEQNPLTRSDKDNTLATIRRYNPEIDLHFWQALLDAS